MRGRFVEYEANMDMVNGLLDDRLLAAKNHMKQIKQRMAFQREKALDTRISIIEETLTILAQANEVILDLFERQNNAINSRSVKEKIIIHNPISVPDTSGDSRS